MRSFRMKSDLFYFRDDVMVGLDIIQNVTATYDSSEEMCHLLFLLALFGSFIKTLYIFPWDLITI